ncbi:MAG: 4'-phosphopantetheinyl transferase superfamily protein [Candidatus Sulfotelmatobacter sp.]
MNITDSNFQIESSLMLPEDEVQLWRADLEAIGVDESRWQQVLSSDELTRASRFHFSRDRQRFVAGRALLRTILAGYLRTDANGLTFSYSKKEKPSLASDHAESGVTFNVSHSGGIALLAFTRGREIGVDVEQVRQDSDLEAIARRFFSMHEQNQLAALPAEKRIDAFLRCWTRKEAYIKATGDGLSLPLNQFDVSLEVGEANALVATRPDSSEAGHWLLREVPAGSGYMAAVCVRGKSWKLKNWSGNYEL